MAIGDLTLVGRATIMHFVNRMSSPVFGVAGQRPTPGSGTDVHFDGRAGSRWQLAAACSARLADHQLRHERDLPRGMIRLLDALAQQVDQDVAFLLLLMADGGKRNLAEFAE